MLYTITINYIMPNVGKKKPIVKGDDNARLQKYENVAFTYNTTYNEVDTSTLINHIARSCGITLSYSVEVSRSGKRHVHGHCKANDWETLKMYLEATDHTPVVKPCYDIKGWERYIMKQSNIITPL